MSQSSNVMRLSRLKEGQTGKVYSIQGGFGIRNRMFELGLIKGQKIRVIRNSGWGPVMVEVKGTRIGIGRGASDKILIEV